MMAEIGWITTIGLTAAFFTSIVWIPQVIKSFRTKKTRDLSLPLTVIASVGMTLWLAYGLLLNDIALIISNGVQVPMVWGLLLMKLRYG